MDCALLCTFQLLLVLQWTPAHSDLCESGRGLSERVLTEGESLWFSPLEADLDNTFTWFWNSSDSAVSTEQSEPVHADGGALFLLNATWGRSGCFRAREQEMDGSFIDHHLRVTVVPENSSDSHYLEVSFGGSALVVNCPSHVEDTCVQLNGTMSWYQDGVLLPEQRGVHMRVSKARPEDQGLYTCVCSWTYQNHQYHSQGTRPAIYRAPSKVLEPVLILSPKEEEQLAHAGSKLLLNCSVSCGQNVPLENCKAWWSETGPNSDRYNFSTLNSTDSSQSTIVTEVLTISPVSAEDFHRQFTCAGWSVFDIKPVTVTVKLRPPQSMVLSVVVGTSVLLLAVLLAVMVKYFSIDLALLSRRLLPFRLKDSGVKVLDAYVVYQPQSQDQPTEDSLTRLLSQDLPRVLEEQCGYRLFIHGRDDLPGEDRVELVEEKIKKSRRLIVILTPGSEVTENYHSPDAYDWQVGLHQALVQRDLSVILIQLGKSTSPGDYGHLPPGLQHLIQRSPPLIWAPKPGPARSNSRFWKRVRYLMPAAPVRSSPVSTI